jgi:hypothetical protein
MSRAIVAVCVMIEFLAMTGCQKRSIPTPSATTSARLPFEIQMQQELCQKRAHIESLRKLRASSNSREIEDKIAELEQQLPPASLERMCAQIHERSLLTEVSGVLGNDFEITPERLNLKWDLFKDGVIAAFESNRLVEISTVKYDSDHNISNVSPQVELCMDDNGKVRREWSQHGPQSYLSVRLRQGMYLEQAKAELGEPKETWTSNLNVMWDFPPNGTIEVEFKDGKALRLSVIWGPLRQSQTASWGG